MADLAFVPVADGITDAPYLIYDGACGSGGILTEADKRIKELAAERGKNVRTHLYGQELQQEIYAIARADMLIKGEGVQADHIFYGSTISNDGFAGKTFDFMISNPPFGTPWKKDLEAWGYKDKKEILDQRFVFAYGGDYEFPVLPNVGDPQMLFLANNISKMKKPPFSSRIVEVHNGSSLFTGSAGQGESNLRRFIIENDLLEAIVALPEKIFYNTGIGTFIWIVTNNKTTERKGKIQLIDATSFKTPLRKNRGEKNCELSPETRRQIIDIYIAFEKADPHYSKVFAGDEFGYWKIAVERPERDAKGEIVLDARGKNKGKPRVDKALSDTEQVPLTYEGGVEAFFKNEILPFTPDAWINGSKTQIGYEISFTKYFYKPVEMRELAEIIADIEKIEAATDGLLAEILRGE